MSITEEIEHGEITQDGDYHRLEKISQRLIDKNSFNEWCHGLEKSRLWLENDCEHEHVERRNIACIAAFINHYCYTALLMGH